MLATERKFFWGKRDFARKRLTPGILKWILDGCAAWQRDGLRPPPEVLTATRGYRLEMDTLGEFLRECCVVDSTATVAFRELYRAYGTWCDDARERPMTRRAMGLRLTERGFEDARIGNDKAVTPDALLADL